VIRAAVRWDAPRPAPGLFGSFVAHWSLDGDALNDAARRRVGDPAEGRRQSGPGTGRSPGPKGRGVVGPKGPFGPRPLPPLTTLPPFPDSRQPAVAAKRVKV